MISKISVIVPCFNEGQTIQQNITKIHTYLQSHFEAFEIIAVNDGSKDNTISELQKTQSQLPLIIVNNAINEGKGKAVKDGFLKAQYDIAMFVDADLGIPIEELEKFIQAINDGYDIAIASRFVPGLKIKEPVSWHRKIMERVFRILRKIILGNWKIEDTQCGFKVFRREAAQKIFKRATVNRFAFDAEVIFLAKIAGYKIKELPITLQNPKSSHVRIILDPINMIISLIQIRLKHLKGLYK